MRVDEFMRQLREVVLNHPDAAQMDIQLEPHGNRPHQPVYRVHLGQHQNRVYVEGER